MAITGKQSQENAELQIKLRAKSIKRIELQEENKLIQHAIHELEQTLIDQKKYIVALQEEHAQQSQHKNKMLDQLWDAKEVWRAESLERQQYIENLTK